MAIEHWDTIMLLVSSHPLLSFAPKKWAKGYFLPNVPFRRGWVLLSVIGWAFIVLLNSGVSTHYAASLATRTYQVFTNIFDTIPTWHK